MRPYVSGAVGGGQIRHVATFPSVALCGANGKSVCSDTVLAGPVFLGAGGGVMINVSDSVALNLGVATQLGFPNFTFNLDINGGVAVEF